MTGRCRDELCGKTYVTNITNSPKRPIPFVPDAAWKDAIFAAAIMLSVIACALLSALWSYGAARPDDYPDGSQA